MSTTSLSQTSGENPSFPQPNPPSCGLRPDKNDYQAHIDGLRAVAVLAVLVFHAFPTVLPGGFIGVDIFFVISGFLISNILRSGLSDATVSAAGVIAGFYCRRINRLFPALVVVMAVCHIIGYQLLMPKELVSLSGQTIAGGAFYLNLLMAGQTDYFSPDPAHNPLLHLWSLGVEEQFYLVWPLYLWLALRCRIGFAPAVVFATTFSFIWNSERIPVAGAGAFYLPHLRLWELSLGACAAAIFPTMASWHTKAGLRGIPLAEGLSLLGAALLAAGFVTLDSSMDLPNAGLLLPTVGTALVICSGGSARLGRLLLANHGLVWIGLLSYPIYLWHWPLLTFARLGSDTTDSLYLKIVALASTVALAWLTYRFVETPAHRSRGSARLAMGLLGCMVVVLGWAGLVRTANGFPNRYPKLLNEIAAYNHDPARAVRQGTYFLSGDQDETHFKVDPDEIKPDRPSLFLWGDSHAASLYPGLNAFYGERVNIVQRTTAKTAPFVPEYFNPGQAQQINGYVLDTVGRIRPRWIVLHANWRDYEWTRIEATIARLQTAEIANIILVGPVPHWIGGLPHQLYNYARKHRGSPVPERLSEGTDPRIAELDRLMASLAARLGIQYISPTELLSNEEGTLVRTGETADSLVTHDTSHLTVSGSRYLVSKFTDIDLD